MSEAPSGRNFVHRANRDGTFDSICPRCFQTIGNKRIEADLEQEEHAHICSAEDAERAQNWHTQMPKKDVHKAAELPPREGFKAS